VGDKKLVNRIEVRVRFSEVDSMAVVWHGNYVKFLEDGREAFGREHGAGYHEIYANGYLTPIVKMELNYLKPAVFGDVLVVETSYVNTEAAKLVFDYKIFRSSDGELLAKARTVQVFTDLEGCMELANPPFYHEWKKKNGLI
jgi:acyl-CoA thioester hydrolase